jgi:hypothetical protein
LQENYFFKRYDFVAIYEKGGNKFLSGDVFVYPYNDDFYGCGKRSAV